MRKHALVVGRKKNIFLVGHGRRFVHLNKNGFGSGKRRIDESEPVISTITKRGPIRLKFNKLQI
jgi:hypothetical protein